MIDQATADALNKALDLAKQGVVGAFETIKTYAPYVWGMARRQVFLEGLELLLTWVIFGILLAVVLRVSKSAICPENAYGYSADNHRVCVLISTAVFVCISLPIMINMVDYLFNPDYWTMRIILALVESHRCR